MHIELSHPVYLFFLLLLGWVVWAYRRSLVDFSLAQRRLSLLVRVLIVLLIALGLAGLTLLHPSREVMFVFLLDRSRSADAEAREKTDDYLKTVAQKAGRTPYAVVEFASEAKIPRLASPEFPGSVFAGEATNATAPSGETVQSEEEKKRELDWSNGTDIAAALEPALALVPPQYVPHLVLLSDGNETRGDALTAALRGGAPVSTVPLPATVNPEVQLVELRTPANVRQGEPFNVEVVVQSNRKTQGRIAVFRGDFKAVDETKPLEIGENVFRFRQTVEDRRQVEFSALVESPEDTLIDNNAAASLVFAGGKPRVLLIESDIRTVRDLSSALKEQDIELEARPAEGLPRTLEELENFETIILSNVPATLLTMRQMDLLRTYVRDLGGGLIMLGGEQSFGLGGYYKTPVEEILPVRSDFEKEKEKPSLALCLVIDRSGSMGGEKMEMAKDAAKSAVELLTARDYVSVIAFDHEVYPIVPMQSAASTAMIASQIATIEAAGGTNIYPGLVEAYEQLNRVTAKLKHVIVLTDGHSAPGDYDGITRQLVNSQVTVSTVGVGDADNELLKHIAEMGMGRHYSCDDPQAIPQIFAKETMTASKSAIHEQPFVPVVITPTEALAGIALDTAPPLLGYVVTRPKPTAQFILATETGEPLLTWWRYGLGMSVAFTSDAKARWAAEWITWPDFATFWAQIIRNTMRKSDARGTVVDMQREDDRVRITLDAVDETEQFINRATGTAVLIEPNLEKREISLTGIAPGRYEANVPCTERGAYHLQLTLEQGGKALASTSRGVVVGYPPELRLKPTNTDLLERLARSTGGLYDPGVETLLAFDSDRTAWKVRPLRPWLLAAAAFLFVLDVLLRRIDFTRRIPNR